MADLTHQMIAAFRASILNGGISAGADALGMSQSSVSRVIAELQKEVGFQLFHKHGRTVKPTDEALALMSKVQQSFLGLEDIARFSEQIRKRKMGRLSISAIPAVSHSIMPDVIDRLRQKYPNVVVTLDIISSIEVVRSVLNRQADIGIGAHGLAVGEVENVCEYSADCVCISGPGVLPTASGHIELRQLAGRPYVALTTPLQKQLESKLKEAGASLDIQAEVSQSVACSELVLRGFGISVVDPFTGHLHRQRGGVTLPLRPSLPFKVHAMAMGDTRLSAQAKDLLLYLEDASRVVRDACG